MEFQYYGGNCISITHKNTRIVIDDNLKELGKKSIIKQGDVALFTYESNSKEARLSFCYPGEYEVGEISIVGVPAKPFMNDDSGKEITMFKLMTSDVTILITGHILGELDTAQKEAIGNVDIMFVPVGNNGYTLDSIGALALIKDIEPKLVIPTHYKTSSLKYPVEQNSLDQVLKDLSMEVKDRSNKLKIKQNDLSEITQLFILEEN